MQLRLETFLDTLLVVGKDGHNSSPHQCHIAFSEIRNLPSLDEMFIELHFGQDPKPDHKVGDCIKATYSAMKLVEQVRIQEFAEHPHHHGHGVQPFEQIAKKSENQVFEQGDIWPTGAALTLHFHQHELLHFLVHLLCCPQFVLGVDAYHIEDGETDIFVDA